MKRIITFLLATLSFLGPTNLFVTCVTGAEYLTGIRVDYLIPKLYLSQLVAVPLVLLLLWLNWQRVQPKRSQLAIASVAFAVLVTQQFTSPAPVVGLVSLAQIFLALAVLALVSRWGGHLNQGIITWSLAVTALFQSLVALWQWFSQRSVAGYWFLGEPSFAQPLGLAKSIWFGREVLLPYGTTAHPNVLAGWLAILSIALLSRWQSNQTQLRKLLLGLIILLSIVVITLSQSISALLTLVIGLGLLYYQRRNRLPTASIAQMLVVGLSVLGLSILVVSLLAKIFPQNDSFIRRSVLQNAAFHIWKDNPMGVGINQSTIAYRSLHLPNNEVVQFIQPVHSVPMLLFIEVGVMGMLALGYLLWLSTKNLPRHRVAMTLLILAPIALFDHYLLSLVPGQWLTVVAFVYLLSENRSTLRHMAHQTASNIPSTR